MKVKVLRPISVGGAVFQKGEVVEVSEDVAKAHGSEYLAEVSEEAEVTAEAPKKEKAPKAPKAEAPKKEKK